MAASSTTGRIAKFGPHLREIRIHLCQKSDASKGVREFIEKHYVPMKKSNPAFPILIRECSGIYPKVHARYAFGRENSTSLTSLKCEDVLKAIQKLAQEGTTSK